MDIHVTKATKMAKKALNLFDLAIKGLEEANNILKKGSEKTEFEIADLLQDKSKIEDKIDHAGKRIEEHEKEFNKNLKKIEKLKEIFGE